MEPYDDAGSSLHPALAVLPGHLLWRAHARVAAATEVEQRAGVDPHAVAALRALVAHGSAEPLSQQDLADAVGISRTTMTRVAAALVATGLVARVRNPLDRRSYALSPTEAGAHAVRTWAERGDAVDEAVTAPFTASERRELVDLLARVAAEESDPGSPTGGLTTGSPTTGGPNTGGTGHLVTRAHQRVHRHLLTALAPSGLEPRLLGTLTLLAATGPIAQAELARHLGVSGASVVAIADDLEALGLVERRRDPDDRRSQLLHLTPAAHRSDGAVARARATVRAVMADQLGALAPAEVERLVVLLNRFVTAP